MLAILLLPLSLQNVTFSAPAAPAQRLLPELGQRMNLSLGADKNAGAAVLLIDVRDISQERLLKTIADVADAEWERDGSRLRLVRTPAKVNQIWQEDAARRQDHIAKSLARDKVRVEKDGPITLELTHRLFDLQVQPKLVSESIPQSARGALAAALTLGPGVLASVRAGQRVVYAPNPNRLQRPLTNALTRVAIQAQRDLAAYQENLYNHKPSKYPDLIFPELDPNLRDDVKTAHVIVTRPSGTDDLVVRLRRFGPSTQAIGESTYTIRFPKAKVTQTVPPIELPPLLREVVGRTEDSPEGKASPSPELAAMLSDPERNEPMELMFGDFVRRFANRRNVVACLPDPAFEAARRALRTSEVDLTGLFAQTDLKAEEADGLVTIRPARPSLAHFDASPRAALRDLIASLRPAGYLRIEPIVAYDQKRPGGPHRGGLDWAVLEALLGNAMAQKGDGLVEFHQFGWALFAATITPDQWRIMADRYLEFNEITPQQRTMMARVMGLSIGDLTLERDTYMRVIFEGMEPTLLEGSAFFATMRGSVVVEPFLALASGGRSFSPGGLPPAPPANQRFFAGTRRVFDCSFRFGTGETTLTSKPSSPVFDVTIRSGDQPVPFERLSPEVRAYFLPKRSGV